MIFLSNVFDMFFALFPSFESFNDENQDSSFTINENQTDDDDDELFLWYG